MSTSNSPVPVFSPPASYEIEALTVSATYLKRAGNEAATRLMSNHGAMNGKLELIAMLRDEMRESAALCECLVAMFDSWGTPDLE